ncbi:MAG: DUF3379 family protein [Woeseiaceae bacterium]
MNCDEYRAAISAEPSFTGAAEHLAGCAACRQFRDEMRALDEAIGRALAVEVPELRLPAPDPSVVAFSPPRRSGRRFPVPAWFAIAATVAIAALLTLHFMSPAADRQSLADEVLAHLDGEPNALLPTDVPVPAGRVSAVVPPNIAVLNGNAGLITYARTCVIDGHLVPHLVIQGKKGAITIILMAEEKVAQAIPVEGKTVEGVILPVGDGSIAIIGERGERLDDVQQKILKSVTWKT